MKKRIIIFISSLSICAVSFAQVQMPDTTGIYGERQDSLSAAVFSASQNGNFISKFKDARVETISAAGLCKMACCNLAESFENSASVTVGYSDAITGARQIRLLGQSGIYTQMLDENRPVMRGLSAPFGLNYVPGQWLESIQISKGVASVINGVESMTGQINMEHRKPTDEKPLYVQASVMNDTKADLNVISSLQLDEEGKWSTVILGHASGNFMTMDMNNDGFADDPLQKMFALSNRWLYYDPSGLQVRFGVRAIADWRDGGQMASVTPAPAMGLWQSGISSKSLNGYVKVGVPLNEDNSRNFAVVTDYTWQSMDGMFGARNYKAGQNSAFVNLLYQDQSSEMHHFTLGLSDMLDVWDESLMSVASYGPQTSGAGNSVINNLGAFGEYTFRLEDKLSVIAGLRADWYLGEGVRVSPRLTARYTPHESIVLRANAGRGLRCANFLSDNIGVLSTGKSLDVRTGLFSHPLEDAWTAGANATWYLPFDKSEKTYLSLDYFFTGFNEQLVVDYDYGHRAGTPGQISVYALGSVPGAVSYTHNYQLDFSTEPLPRFTVTLTGRYTDAGISFMAPGGKARLVQEKPMTSRYKAVLNLQYATNLQKWIFDFTASLNGPCRVWDFMLDRYPSGRTEAYPLLYAQVTKRFKGVDLYVGGENLTNYTQKDPILSAADPWSSNFDASCIWGPLMGVRVYAGVRVTLWKTEK